MRIVFLQNMDNAKGGIATVNLKLMSYFLSLGHQVAVVSIRHSNTWETLDYPAGTDRYLINDRDIWGCPRLKEVLEFLKNGKIVHAVKTIKNRYLYKKSIEKDYSACRQLIKELQPDVIINSHYEVLAGIDASYLSRTIMHFHTSFDQVYATKSYRTIFNKYADRIFRFLWLTEKTKEEAVRYGWKNSVCIYNPLPFASANVMDLRKKKVIFLGRLAEEKRIHLAIEYFKEVIAEENNRDWIFEIYGDGPLKEEIESLTKNEPQIFYMGRTDSVQQVLLESSLLLLTSDFEGMPLVVLEANECGVPALIYDFGESSREVIKHGETGVIIPQNDSTEYKKALKELMSNEPYRKMLSENAKEFANQFSIETIGQQWIKLFQELENEYKS
ncbi:MAG: glycosyltransferase family 4 protein [Lachnospiraceae bacterium]|nr:glycosyltransferase family 4 protein [Lachnospiraceae bacterium]